MNEQVLGKKSNIQFFMPRSRTNEDAVIRVLESRHSFKIPSSLFAEFALAGLDSYDAAALNHFCLNKLKFRWRSEVVRRVLAFKEVLHGNVHFGIYKCGLCGGWHFTHSILDNAIDCNKGGRHKRYRKRRQLMMREKLQKLNCCSEVEIIC